MQTLRQLAQKINNMGIKVALDEPMASHTTFHIGGPADLFVWIKTASELARVTKVLEEEGVPVFVLGGGANLLVCDEGFRGAIIDLTGLCNVALCRTGDAVCSEAGIAIDTLAEQYLALGLEGMEDFYGMPGTLGGALFMNARCYEHEISELVEGFWLLKDSNGHTLARNGRIEGKGYCQYFANDPLLWGYKRSPFQQGEPYAGRLIVSAKLRARPGSPESIASRMRSRKNDRQAKGHYRYPSAGSMFKNNRSFGKPTGMLIDGLGLRGMRIGDAQVAPWHGNIFVNRGSARAKDMIALIKSVRTCVLEAFGFALEPEVVFLDENGPAPLFG
ncbi:MAG TPA: UDP-N-acetylmuramate dehydrogenase [Spirochaetales bacterium]|nr:UDP-N-acetylmuramate dehydrogenase [Spirochaetales bacterium]